VALNPVRADGALFVLRQQVGPAVLPIPQRAGGAMSAVYEDAERLRTGPRWSGHDLHQDRGLIEACRRNVFEVFDCDARPLGEPG